jgi:tRNA A-37 threonylcarbamoyl transferase component Bud32
MTRAAAAGYPAPRVFEVGHSELVMERIQGPTMFEDLVARPERLEEHAALLADLHDRLHRLGIRHRDLHPQNVILAGSGPTVIDWEAADEGDPSVDIAETWVLLAAAELQPEIARARDRFLAIFLRHVDRDAARTSLAGVVANRQRDPHMTATELERMAALLVEEGLSASSWPGGSPSTSPTI